MTKAPNRPASTPEAEHDFPAAHSMDTQWFAVDEQGRVGVFDTGEDGALPNAAAFGMGPADPNFDEYELAALRVAHSLASGADPIGDWRPEASAGRTLVVVDVKDEEAAQEVVGAIPEQDFVAISSAPPFVFLSKQPLTIAQVEELRESEGVRWTFDMRDSYELFDRYQEDDGLFHFSRDHGEDPGLYTLAHAPQTPLEVPAGLEELKASIGRLQLPVDFSQSKQVHLDDYLEDGEWETWGDLPLRYTQKDLAEMESEAERLRERAERRNDPELQRAKVRLLVLVAVFLSVLLYLWLR